MDQRLKQINKIAIFSIFIMITTAVHHYYAAVVYQTPFRLHMIPIAIIMLVYTFSSLFVIRKWLNQRLEITTRKLLIIITLIFSGGIIGLIEGFYNHVVKIISFMIGLPDSILTIMFPPSIYVHPDNWFNEATGVLQFLFAVLLIQSCYRYFSTKL
jgi:hypothetical protein